MPTSLSHEPVAKISGCCNDEYDTGRHLVLLIFWDTYLAFIFSIEIEHAYPHLNKKTKSGVSLAFMRETEMYAPAKLNVTTVAP